MMIEIDEPRRRDRVLRGLGGVEHTAAFLIGDEKISAVPETDTERTTPDGKTSSIHFLRFPFTGAQVDAFRVPGTRVLLGLSHPEYDHTAAVSEAVRATLAADFA